MSETESLPDGIEYHESLNDAQRRLVEATLEADSGLFVQASVPGAGKTYAGAGLYARCLLQRAADGVDRPASGLGAVAFNRDAAEKLIPEIAGWLRWLVYDDTIPAARHCDQGDVDNLIGQLRRIETVGTIDSVIYRIFDDIATELGFEDPEANDGYALDQLHQDAFDAVLASSKHDVRINRLRESYPPLDEGDDEDDIPETDAASGDETGRIADVLRTILETARDHGWSVADVDERLHEGRNACYPAGAPSGLTDIEADLRQFDGAQAELSVGDMWSPDQVVAIDRELYDVWGDRIDDLVGVYRSYVRAYERLSRERGVVSHVDCAYWVNRYFADPACAHRLASPDISHELVTARRDRLRQRWQSHLDLLVVDEAQDLSSAQHDALSHLVTNETRVVLYGDVHQTIYTWRNASPTLFSAAISDGEYFGVEWEDPVVETAQTTYRQRPAIAQVVNDIFGSAIQDPSRGVSPAIDTDYASLGPTRPDVDGPSIHVAAFKEPINSSPTFDDWYFDDEVRHRSGEVLAEYLLGGLVDGRFDTGDDPPPIRVLFRRGTKMDAVRKALEDVGLTVGTPEPVFRHPLAQAVVTILQWLVSPMDPDHTAATLCTLGVRDESDAADVTEHVASADYDLFTATAQAGDLEADSARFLTDLEALATDIADRNRRTVTELAREVCAMLVTADDPLGIQSTTSLDRCYRIRDEVIAAVDDLAAPETAFPEAVAALTTACAEPEEHRCLPVDASDYDVVFETIHSFKGEESSVIALGDPAHSPHGQSYKNTIIARGDTLAICPPDIDARTDSIPVDGYDGGLFEPGLPWSDARDSGLRWMTNRLRRDSQTTYAGPSTFAAVAAQDRAEHWRLGYVAATRARDHLVVPIENVDDWQASASWSHAFGSTLRVDELDGMKTVDRSVDGESVMVSKDDVSTRNPLENLLPSWDGRTLTSGSADRPVLDTESRPWLPRFLNASTFYPLSEDHDRYVLDHLLGKQLHTDSGTIETDAPLGDVGPGTLGTITHDAIASMVRTNTDLQATRNLHVLFDDHVQWALRHAQLEHNLTDKQRQAVETYLSNCVLPEFVETDAFDRLCTADEVYIEDPIETQIRIDGVRIDVRGQADFIARDGSEWFVEDVKLAFANGTDETDERYRLQLATYQWVLRRQNLTAAEITGRISHLDGRDGDLRVPEGELDQLIEHRLKCLGE